LRQASRVLIRLYERGDRRAAPRGAHRQGLAPLRPPPRRRDWHRRRRSARTPKGTPWTVRKFLLSTLALAASGCSDPRSHRNAVYMLVDTSGTYAREAEQGVADRELPARDASSPATHSQWHA